MDSKKQIENQLELLKSAGWSRARIEKELNYSENYIDQVLAKGGNARFLKSLQEFAKRVLQNASVPHGTSDKASDKYLELLEDNDRFFKKIIHTNLAKADFVQESILAHLKAMIQQEADEKAGKDPKKREKIMHDWGKRIAANLGLPVEMDILAGGK